jgi:uncharacterized protein (TIGR02284 family)
MENTKATVEILNDLVQINNDRINGFEHALKDVASDEHDLKYLFTNCVGESHQFKMALGTEVEALSKEKDIDNTTSVSGKIHRAWIDIKTAFTGHSAKSVLEECEFGEDAILLAYKTALSEDFLPAYIREMLEKQQAILQEAHNEIKSLRDHV